MRVENMRAAVREISVGWAKEEGEDGEGKEGRLKDDLKNDDLTETGGPCLSSSSSLIGLTTEPRVIVLLKVDFFLTSERTVRMT